MLQPKDIEWPNGYKKKDPYICCLQEPNFRPRDTYRLEVRAWKKILHANGNQNKAGVTILSDKIVCKDYYKKKRRTIHNDQGSIQEEEIRVVNIYAPNIGAPQYIRQMLTAIKGKIDSNTVMIGDFDTPLSPKDRASKMKINEETQALNDPLDKMLIDIHRIFHPKQQNILYYQVLMEYSPG